MVEDLADGEDFETVHTLDVADFDFEHIGIDCLDQSTLTFCPVGAAHAA